MSGFSREQGMDARLVKGFTYQLLKGSSSNTKVLLTVMKRKSYIEILNLKTY